MRRDYHILVTWFGPFVDASHLGSFVDKLTRSHEIMKEIAEAVIVTEDDTAGEDKIESGKKELVERYWKNVKDALAKIESKKIELKGM
jgi:hypothetical protein